LAQKYRKKELQAAKMMQVSRGRKLELRRINARREKIAPRLGFHRGEKADSRCTGVNPHPISGGNYADPPVARES